MMPLQVETSPGRKAEDEIGNRSESGVGEGKFLLGSEFIIDVIFLEREEDRN